MKVRESLKKWLWPTTRCVLCGGKSAVAHPGLCDDCYGSILEEREREIFCPRCGSFYADAFRECPRCYGRERRFPKNTLFTAVAYSGGAANLVQRAKYNNRRDLAPAMARLFFRYSEIDEDFDVVTAVPLHRRRLRERGYNQSEDLARAIAEGMNLPYEELLRRVVDTTSQTKLSYRQRLKNMMGAFAVLTEANVEGRGVLVVDDVVTTGATALECRRVLMEAGAKRVAIASFAAGKVKA